MDLKVLGFCYLLGGRELGESFFLFVYRIRCYFDLYGMELENLGLVSCKGFWVKILILFLYYRRVNVLKVFYLFLDR